MNQDQPTVQTDTGTCETFKAMVTDVPAGSTVRWQLGHDLVEKDQVTEQDTAASFTATRFPASDWGFSVRVDDHVIYDKIVTVKPCAPGELPFTGTGQIQAISLFLALALILVGIVAMIRTRA